MVNCPTCDAPLSLSDTAENGEIMACSDCGTELEIVSVKPVAVKPAPKVQEDWGE